MNEPKPRIITVTGKRNSGKTTLVKNVYNYLVKQGAFILYYDVTGAHFEDIRAVVIWKGKVIALCSIGDYADDDFKTDDTLWPLTYIKDGIDIAIKHKAEILLNTYSSGNMTENDYKQLLKNKFGDEIFTPCLMTKNVYQTDCIKQNQEKLDFILNEIVNS